jgi:SAM-dependent methyltransferase
MELVRPHSVVDVGCGNGAWLAEFVRRGAAEVLGLDTGEFVVPDAIPFRPIDLTASFTTGANFDLATCLEVGEHLSPDTADSLVSSLVQLAPVVVFSAAIPGQRGIGHVNEQWPDYWRELFASCSYQQLDLLRARLWNDQRVAYWYRQNLFLYASASWIALHPKTEQRIPQRVVHPELFEKVEVLSRPEAHGLGRLLRAIPHSARRAVLKRVRPSRGSADVASEG